MNKIGIIGSESYKNTIPIYKLFKTIKDKYGPFAIICSGGTLNGVEYIAKKLALELNFMYKEFNPSYTGRNAHSAMPENYYGKNYHFSHLMDRYKQLIRYCDYVIIFIEKGSTIVELNYAINYANKLKKKVVVVN